jgi:hypothetical protein
MMTENQSDATQVEGTGSATVDSANPDVTVDVDAAAVTPRLERVRSAPILRVSRWWAAAVATVLVVAGTIGVIAAAGSAATASSTTGYVPADAVAYLEVRLDLPGDQGDQASRLLQHFPGLLDSAILDQKVSMVLDRLLGTSTDGRYRYTTDVAPWITGQAAAVLVPSAGERSTRPFAGGMLVGVKDGAVAAAQLERFRADAVAGGAEVTSTVVDGITAWTLNGGTLGRLPDGITVALAPDMLLVAATPEEIAGFLRVKAGTTPGIVTVQAFRDQVAHAPDARVGTMYVNAAALVAQLKASMPAGAMSSLPTDPFSRVPTTVVGWLRVEGDRIVADARASGMPAGSERPVRESQLLGGVPADALAYVETRDAGTAIRTIFTQVLAMPGLSEQLGQVRQAESLLGTKIENFFDWVGDLAIVVTPGTGGTPAFAIVAETTDRTTAAARVGVIRTLLAFGGTQLGLRATDVRHGEVTITSIELPSSAGLPDGAPTSIAWALDGDRFILATGADAVAALLDVKQGSSLGDDPRFRDLLAAAGGPATAGIAYVNVAATRSLIEAAAIAPAERQHYETDVRPYLAPVDRLIAVSGRDGDVSTARIIITVGPSPQAAPVATNP